MPKDSMKDPTLQAPPSAAVDDDDYELVEAWDQLGEFMRTEREAKKKGPAATQVQPTTSVAAAGARRKGH